MPEQISQAVIDGLIEANETLVEENGRLRNNNRVLRTVIAALRGANEKLRTGVIIAQQNDELFKSFCQGDFDAPVSSPAESGLLKAGTLVDAAV